jgi:ligand-binding SRPBCC domain-containing protein
MPVIELNTLIYAPIERCFDLSRSIELHRISTAGTGEKAIAGVTSGLIGLHESVTWEAVHLGVKQQLTSVISGYNRPWHFRDEQVKGAFRYFHHDHYFWQQPGAVLMNDRFEYASPFGLAGRLFNQLILTAYLRKFLQERNQVIKAFAESDRWKNIQGEGLS